MVDLTDLVLNTIGEDMSQKVVMGVPFYGRAWDGVAFNNETKPELHGLFAPYNRSSKFCQQSYDYNVIQRNFTAQQGWLEMWDNASKVPVLYNEAERKVCSYENPTSLAIKAEFIRSKKLGGAFAWEFKADNSKRELFKALADHL